MRVSTYVIIAIAAIAMRADAACTQCHAGYADALAQTPHRALDRDGNPDAACTSCHGDGAAHMANPMAGGVLAFDEVAPHVTAEACGGCHTDQHAGKRSAHARAGVRCTDCHTAHPQAAEAGSERDLLPALASLGTATSRLSPGSASCASCHEDVLAQFAFNKRHRLLENSITCASCHDPHAESQSTRLAGAASEVCADCHADKQGPFIFEHAASRVDGCLSCHTPHGSANRHLLTHQEVGAQCYSCHAAVPQFHLGFGPPGPARFGTDSVCTNCHVTIHGSNLDPAFLK